MNIMNIKEEDAFNFIIRCLREGLKHVSYSNYGYDLYLPHVMREYLIESQNCTLDNIDHNLLKEISPSFYEAAWNLCRRGILRPGIKKYNEQETSEGSAGNGFSITQFGKQWLKEHDKDSFVPTEPERFAQMLGKSGSKFGPGFLERSQEAIRCYGAHAYLACCAMCGAAAESILLYLAIAKKKDEHEVLKIYYTRNGRVRIENILIGQQKKNIQNEFRGYTSLLKYWRDISVHGKKCDISDNEAFTSLVLLLRFSIFVNENYEELIK